jgi:hypothetical protein
MLFNATDGVWQSFYVSKGTTLNPIAAQQQGAEGWDIFETKFSAIGNCPFVPEIHSFAKQYLDSATGTWQYLEYEPGAQYNDSSGYGTDCLNDDDGSGRGNYYTIGYAAGLHDWTVDSNLSVRQPPGGGGGDPGCDPTVQDCCYGLSCFCFDPAICCDLYGTGCCNSFTSTSPCAYSVGSVRKPSSRRRQQEPSQSTPILQSTRNPASASDRETR